MSDQQKPRALNVYVASSWRNKYQPEAVTALRAAGHDVYDFRNPAPGNDGFRWSEIDQNWENWTVEQYAASLDHPVARKGFKLDLAAVLSADLCVLVLPSGRSASWEYGYHCGSTGRPGIVYMPERCEPELMYSGSTFVNTVPDLVAAANAYAESERSSAEDFHTAVVLGQLLGVDYWGEQGVPPSADIIVQIMLENARLSSLSLKASSSILQALEVDCKRQEEVIVALEKRLLDKMAETDKSRET